MSGASIIGGMLAIGLNFKGAAGQLRGIGGKVYGWWTGKGGIISDSANPNLGQGTLFNHYTNGEGIKGITGVNPESLQIGKPVYVRVLRFGKGTNDFLAGEAGDIFVTELGPEVSSGQLQNIGVFGDRQNFVIQFSQEAALNNGVRAIDAGIPGRSIYTIPGGTTLSAGFDYIIQRLR